MVPFLQRKDYLCKCFLSVTLLLKTRYNFPQLTDKEPRVQRRANIFKVTELISRADAPRASGLPSLVIGS
jgi:hypothetical protein